MQTIEEKCFIRPVRNCQPRAMYGPGDHLREFGKWMSWASAFHVNQAAEEEGCSNSLAMPKFHREYRSRLTNSVVDVGSNPTSTNRYVLQPDVES